MFTDDQIRVCRNLLDIGRRYEALDGVPRLFHLLIPHQESGWIEDNPGDQGHSNGPYQIYQPAHPRISQGVAIDPGFDYGFWEIHDAWKSVWLAQGIDWVHSDGPTRTAWLETYAPQMQGSINWTAQEAASAYADSLLMLEILS